VGKRWFGDASNQEDGRIKSGHDAGVLAMTAEYWA
jgi:hypothetical protein